MSCLRQIEGIGNTPFRYTAKLSYVGHLIVFELLGHGLQHLHNHRIDKTISLSITLVPTTS